MPCSFISGIITAEEREIALETMQMMLEDVPELADDLGFKFTRLALKESTARYAVVEGEGIAGAVGYHTIDLLETGAGTSGKALYVEYIGSTGLVPGTGSGLMRELVEEAAAKGMGIVFEPENAGAEAFFKKMGMRWDPYSVGSEHIMGLTAEQVARLAAL